MSDQPLLSEGLVVRRVRVPRHEVAFLRYILEAYDGLANLHGTRDGQIRLVTTVELANALDELLVALCHEMELEILPDEGVA